MFCICLQFELIQQSYDYSKDDIFQWQPSTTFNCYQCLICIAFYHAVYFYKWKIVIVATSFKFSIIFPLYFYIFPLLFCVNLIFVEFRNTLQIIEVY